MTRYLKLFCSVALFMPSLLIAREYIPPMPQDFDQVDMYLQTVDAGDAIYMAFGHTLLRVVDRVAYTDVVYNWGVFDFRTDGFLQKFVTGNIRYRMDQYSMAANLNHYRFEKRSVWEDLLNLTVKQKETLMKRVIWQAQPENRDFPYLYYTNNCSTKVRDYIDEALAQVVFATFKDDPGSETLRQAIRRHFLAFPFTGLATEILMNKDLELQMTKWQEMFLPLLLRKHLSMLPQYDDDGHPMEGTKLLTGGRELLNYALPAASPLSGFQIVFLIFALPLMLIGVTAWRGVGGSWIRRLFGLSLFFWGLFSGFFGVAMIFMWAFSLYVHTFHSANLWVFWPTDFLWCWLGLRLFFSPGKQLSRSKEALVSTYFAMHVLAALLLLLLWTARVTAQDVSNILWYLVPVSLMCNVLWWRFFRTTDWDAKI